MIINLEMNNHFRLHSGTVNTHVWTPNKGRCGQRTSGYRTYCIVAPPNVIFLGKLHNYISYLELQRGL